MKFQPENVTIYRLTEYETGSKIRTFVLAFLISKTAEKAKNEECIRLFGGVGNSPAEDGNGGKAYE